MLLATEAATASSEPLGAPVQAGASFSHHGRTLALGASHRAVYDVALNTFAEIACDARSTYDHLARVDLEERHITVAFDRKYTRMRVRFDDGDSTDLAAFYAVSEVFSRFAAASRSHFALYAAAVQIGAGALVIAGPTTVGKTVLALHLAARGARLYGDELILVARASRAVESLRRCLMLREPALQLLPNEWMRAACRQSPSAIECTRGRLWYALDPDDLCDRDVRASAAPLAGIILVEQRALRSSMERLVPAVGALEVARRSFRNERGLAQLRELCELLSAVPIYRMQLGAATEAASLIEAAFGPCA